MQRSELILKLIATQDARNWGPEQLMAWAQKMADLMPEEDAPMDMNLTAADITNVALKALEKSHGEKPLSFDEWRVNKSHDW